MQKRIFIIFVFFLFIASMGLMAQDISLLWNTFLGSSVTDLGEGIALDSSGNIYLTGYSGATWGSPVHAYSGGNDVFVACLNSSGSLVWNTFLGSASNDYSSSITLDGSGNLYVTGYGYATWGTPVNAHSGSLDVIVACLGSSGSLIWNTFLGSDSAEYGIDITMGSSGNVYVTGYGTATWGSPVNAYSGDDDAFTACLNNSGSLIWNTFLGSASEDRGYGIALDNSENVYVTGPSLATWGSPGMPTAVLMMCSQPVSTVPATCSGTLF